MDYLCSECSTQLSKWEIELNELYPVGKLYCEFCQSKHERQIIKKMAEDFANELDFYDFSFVFTLTILTIEFSNWI